MEPLQISDDIPEEFIEKFEEWRDEMPPPPGFEEYCKDEAEAALRRIDRESWIIRATWMEPGDKKMLVLNAAVEHVTTEAIRKIRWAPFNQHWLLRLEKGGWARFD